MRKGRTESTLRRRDGRRRNPGAAQEFGLRDFSQVALGSASRSEAGDIRAKVPASVVAVEDEARGALLDASADQLVASVAALPETMLVYRKEGRRGELLVAREALRDPGVLRDAVSWGLEQPHPVWGRSLPGLPFALVGDIGHTEAERWCRVAYFSEAPTHYKVRAAWGLRAVPDDDVFEALLRDMTSSKSEALREGSMDALGASRHPKAGAACLKALRSLAKAPPDDTTRSRAAGLARALGKLQYAPALPVLRQAMRRRQSSVIANAADALVLMGSREALETVASEWERPKGAIEAAARALILLGPDVAFERARAFWSADLAEDHTAKVRIDSLLLAMTERIRSDDAARAALGAGQHWYDAVMELTEGVAGDVALDFLVALRKPGTAAALVGRLERLDDYFAVPALIALGDTSAIPALEKKLARMPRRAAAPYLKVIRALSGSA